MLGSTTKSKRPLTPRTVDALPPEELGDVLEVLAEEVEGARVVVLHRLRDVDHVGLPLVVQQVELAEVAVNQPV